MNPQSERIRRWATGLAMMLLATAGPVLAAEVEGRILGPAGVTPITGAVVTFHHLNSSMSVVSSPTAADGSYTVLDLPAGEYDIAVSTGRGLWLANESLVVGAGELQTLAFALRERAYWEDTGEMPQPTTLPDQEIIGVAVLLERENKPSDLHPGRKRNLLIGAGIGIAVLALALASGDSGGNDSEASPFVPAP